MYRATRPGSPPEGPSNIPSKVAPEIPGARPIYRAKFLHGLPKHLGTSWGSVCDAEQLFARELAPIVPRQKDISWFGDLTHVVHFISLPLERGRKSFFSVFKTVEGFLEEKLRHFVPFSDSVIH